jgi:hypothetical protein
LDGRLPVLSAHHIESAAVSDHSCALSDEKITLYNVNLRSRDVRRATDLTRLTSAVSRRLKGRPQRSKAAAACLTRCSAPSKPIPRAPIHIEAALRSLIRGPREIENENGQQVVK